MTQQDGATHFPSWIRYAGTLSGQAIQSVNLSFAIYKEQQGGEPLWQESQNVELDASGALFGTSGPGKS